MVETKVQVDLENALSRLMPREDFLVQVNTDVVTHVERRLVEGETITTKPEPTRPPVDTMPGFLPEPDIRPPPPPPETRETYRIIETPELKSVLVRVNFDETVPLDVMARGKSMVQSYMQESYPNKAVMTFNTIPMLKPKPIPTDAAGNKDKSRSLASETEPKPEEIAWNYARWAILALLLLLFLMVWQSQRVPAVSRAPRRKPRTPEPFDNFEKGTSAGAPANYLDALKSGLSSLRGFGRPVMEDGIDGEEQILEIHRKKLLGKFLMKSDAFRLYYGKLKDEERSELFAALNGPAYDSLLNGLGLAPVPGESSDTQMLEERMAFHEKNFDEFAAAKDWQDRQFFGFLQQLNEEQILSLVQHESALAIALMLKYMRPHQSAMVLDTLNSNKRVEVIAQLASVSELPLSKMYSIEREVRLAAQRVPQHTPGATRQEEDFWGEVLAESSDQESLLGDLERTNPEIFPKLAKFKFKLEDAATLPNNLLQRVLGNVENDELGMALATCSQDVVEVILEAVSTRRRDLLMNQIDNYRTMPRDQVTAARLKLTKKFREALA
jgi:hypothetical protein